MLEACGHPAKTYLELPTRDDVAPSRDLVRPGEATRGSRCAGRSALRAQASAHRLARIMSYVFDVRDDLDHQVVTAHERTTISRHALHGVRREKSAPEMSCGAGWTCAAHQCCSCEQ